jgi:hypothetical protein
VTDAEIALAVGNALDVMTTSHDVDEDDFRPLVVAIQQLLQERNAARADVARLTVTYDNTCSCALADASQPTLAHAKDCPIRVNKIRRLDPGVALDRLAAALHSGDEVDELRSQIERMTARAEEQQRLAAKALARDQRDLIEIDSVLASAGAHVRGSIADSVRALITDRDAYRAMVCDLLASASPHPTEHPTMTKQWARARELLKNGPDEAQRKAEHAVVDAAIAWAKDEDIDAFPEVVEAEFSPAEKALVLAVMKLRGGGLGTIADAIASDEDSSEREIVDVYVGGRKVGEARSDEYGVDAGSFVRTAPDPEPATPAGCFRCGKSNDLAPLASETPAGTRYVCAACVQPGDAGKVVHGDTLVVTHTVTGKDPAP